MRVLDRSRIQSYDVGEYTDRSTRLTRPFAEISVKTLNTKSVTCNKAVKAKDRREAGKEGNSSTEIPKRDSAYG